MPKKRAIVPTRHNSPPIAPVGEVERLDRAALGRRAAPVVARGRRHAGVPGELLHGAEVDPSVQQVADEGAAEVVGLSFATPASRCRFAKML